MNWKLFALIIISLIATSIFALGVIYIWFDRPNDEAVKTEFLAKNPTFEVTSLYVGEGNSDFAEYHINYKKPNDEKLYEYITTYQRCANNEWKISCMP